MSLDWWEVRLGLVKRYNRSAQQAQFIIILRYIDIAYPIGVGALVKLGVYDFHLNLKLKKFLTCQGPVEFFGLGAQAY